MEPIAIIGIGCRFPQAPNPKAFWQLLCNGVDAITEIPSDRWDITQWHDPDPETPGKMCSRYGGFLDQVDQFDPHLFGISPREAVSMDPQQRLLLEVAWEALEDGGQVREALAGSNVGVFVGISTNDYSRVESDYDTQPQGYDLTGNALNIAAGRLSYLLNLRGPSLIVDTACSSSLVAVHLACQSIWNQEATMALAAGVNVILSPIGNLGLTKLKALSPDGRCKAFDASANGYVRSEGAGCVVLKPLTQALQDGDPIYATIRGSAINHDGRSKGLTVPYGPSQTAVIRAALARAGVSPGDVNYIEAHGTGTPLGDPIEVMALAEVLSEQREAGALCSLGTVKSNIGHLEAAAGIASLIKVALALKHGNIPLSVHFQTPNPHIPFAKLPLRVQTSLSPWPTTEGLAKAGVSAFGFAGTNAHVVLEQPPAVTPSSAPSRDAYLLPLSAHTPAALQALIRHYETWLVTSPEVTLRDVCYTASARRTHHKYRLAVVASSLEDLQQQLGQLQVQADHAPIKRRAPKVAFVFTGEAAQWLGMGQVLWRTESVFRGAIQDCDALIRDYAGWSLLAELTADASHAHLADPAIAQPMIFALQVALAHLWDHWGIQPQAIAGHGLGEIAAAHVAGYLSLRDAVQRVCDRAQANTPEVFIAAFKNSYELNTAKLPLFSTTAADWLTTITPDTDHWGRTLTASDDALADSLATLTEAGYATLLAISPQPQLHTQLQAREAKSLLPSRCSDQPECATLLRMLGKLYAQGQALHWAGLFPAGGQVVSLPLYPWQRERYWVEKTPAKEASTNPGHPLIAQPLALALEDTVFAAHLSLQQQPWLQGYQVAGQVVLPGAAYLEMALVASQHAAQSAMQLEDVTIDAAMLLPATGGRQVQMVVSPAGAFRILSTEADAPDGPTAASEWTQHASGRLAPAEEMTPKLTLSEAQARCADFIDQPAYYQQLRSRSLEYGPSFQGLQQLWRGHNEALGRMQLPEGISVSDADAYHLHPVLMDAGFQLLSATLPDEGQETFLPVGLGRLQLLHPITQPLWIHGKIQAAEASQPVQQADLHLFDEAGQCLAILQSLQVRRIQPQVLQKLLHPAVSGWQDWLYTVNWQPQLVPAGDPRALDETTGCWLLLADAGEVAFNLAQQLSQRGQTCIQVYMGTTLVTEGEQWQVNPQQPETFQQLCEAVIRYGLPLRGVVHCWGADHPCDDSLTALQQAQTVGTQVGLLLAQELADTLSATGGKLWFVTRGTQAVEVPVAQVGAAPLAGLGRVIALERPEIWGGLVDLAPVAQAHEAEQLLADLMLPTGDTIALRQQRYVARLNRSTIPSSAPLTLKADGTYLITGGLGSLGRQLAQSLIAQGAKHLVLISRRAVTTLPAELVTVGTDVTIQVLQGDVTDREALSRLLKTIQQTLPPLRGIFHAAGILDDSLIPQQSPARLERVMAPKVMGAWNLHQLTQELPLDYFMMFSSIAAMVGSPGQANYAAANSFLDSLAHYRQGQGLPALSINWGTWATDGMTEQLNEREQARLAALGLAAIDPESGMAALGHLLQQSAAQVGVVPVRWEQFLAQTPTIPPLLVDLTVADDATEIGGKSEVMTALAVRPAAERGDELLKHLQEQLRIVLRLSPTHVFDVHQGFFDLGMDSLTSVELRNTLQKSLGHPLPSTLIFDYPTLDALAKHLAVALFPDEPAATPSPARQDTASVSEAMPSIVTDVETLSEEEAERLLLEALNTIRH